MLAWSMKVLIGAVARWPNMRVRVPHHCVNLTLYLQAAGGRGEADKGTGPAPGGRKMHLRDGLSGPTEKNHVQTYCK